MRVLKGFQYGLSTFAFMTFFAMGVYNSALVNSDSFMQISDIKFVKRLDEMQGKVEFGRMAASHGEWQSLQGIQVPEVAPAPIKKQTTLLKKKNEIKRVANNKSKVLPPPAIDADLEMTVSNVFFKGPIDASKVSGSAKSIDGFIEEIYIVLPDNKVIDIQTVDRMVGNVFQYEDSVTREVKSGMFYEIKKGTYMVTLTNDSQYAGLRVELKTNEGEEVAFNDNLYENVNFN